MTAEFGLSWMSTWKLEQPRIIPIRLQVAGGKRISFHRNALKCGENPCFIPTEHNFFLLVHVSPVFGQTSI
jgi:hypothetical protein